MLLSALSALSRRRRSRPAGTGPTLRRTLHPRLEALENRCLPAIITVNTVIDNGSNINPTPGSLREAIIEANGSSGSIINFNIAPSGTQVIAPPSPLLAITADNVTIDATPGQDGNSVENIELDGVGAGSANGLVLDGNNDQVVSLSIVRFQLNGIELDGTSHGSIDSDLIGTDFGHEPNLGNGGNGVVIEPSPVSSSANNTVKDCTIVSNGGDGVALIGANTSGNSVVNNLIGVISVTDDPDRVPRWVAYPNLQDGVAVFGGANHNVIGGTGLFLQAFDPNGSGNVISGNVLNGVFLSDSGTNLNTVQGNLIGTDPTGKQPIPNGQFGVEIIDNAGFNLTGGMGGVAITSGLGNVISGNGQGGVDVRTGAMFNQVQGNFIGTSVTGGGKLGNGGNGVTLESGAFATALGGPGLGNVISANNGDGVEITDSGTSGNVLQDNRVGTNAAASAALGNTAEGVLIANGAGNNTVGGLYGVASALPVDNVISGNKANGVAITGKGTTDNVVEGNLIGTNASVLKALPNGRDGVVLTHDAADNTVGGSDPRAGNLISGNTESGILINHSATASLVQGNDIGTGAGGAVALANGQDGIDLLTSGNSVLANLISGNLGSGLVLQGSQNLIQSNRIGTDVTGTFSVANQHDGVLIDILTGSGGNTVGGTVRGSGNLISGNGWNGIDISGPVSAGNLIEGNDIGTDALGKKAVANTRDGIRINNTSGYTIGGALPPLAGNVISGNGQDGVEITGRRSSGLTLLGNRIGTNFPGTAAVPNLGNGVDLHDGAGNNTVGGTGGAAGNVISGNGGDGVLIAVADANVISANRIGTNFGGSAALPNQGNGVHIVHAGGNTVGGAAAAYRNLISGNAHDGVLIASGSHDNVVLGDRIGTDSSGTKALQNGADGVDLVQAAVRNTVGGIPSTSMPSPGNVISGNHGSGVVITGDGTEQNLVEGNYIGTTVSGAAALGNLGDGVDVLNRAAINQVGGQGGVGLGGAGNLISANAGDGVQIADANANAVQGNWIGTDASGQSPLGNAGHGVFVAHGATNNSIGGAPPAGGNVIAYNAKAGVAVLDVTTLHNPILSNGIYGNGGLGIDLGDNGLTPNAPGGPHIGPNEFQNFPVIQGAVVAGSSINVSLNSIPNTSFTIQLFASPAPDPTGYGQGKTPLVTLTITTDALGNGFVVWHVPLNLKGLYLSATATDPSGDTSEFSKAVQVA
jgi:hypothetical protein